MLKAPEPHHPEALHVHRLTVQGAMERGPVLVCVCAQHGNEPSGVHATERVLETIKERDLPLRGAVVALIANIAALRNHSRFMEQDLNRMWTSDRVHAVTSGMLDDDFMEHLVAERFEQSQIIQAIDHITTEAAGPISFIDLHTTSAPSAPFCVLGDSLRNRRLAAHLPVTRILGAEEVLEGTLPDYINQLGLASVGFEAGQHDDPLSIELHESAIWLLIEASGILHRRDIPDFDRHYRTLSDASLGLPPVVEVRDHHRVGERDGFRMQPGFDNFQLISEGELLGADNEREFHASENGRIFMPLYQKLGEDGYFVVHAVPPGWLTLTGWLRRLKTDRLLPLLPALRRSTELPATLVVDESRAGRLTWSLLHALGYRRGRRIDGQFHAARGLFDLGHGNHGRLISCTNKPLRTNTRTK